MWQRFSYRLIPSSLPVAPFRPATLRYLSALRSPAVWRWFLLAFILWTVFDTLLVHHRITVAYDERRIHEAKPNNSTRVYIASLHWNNERILRDSWNQGVLDLVDAFGPDNVFVSVYESGSSDGSKDLLRELDQSLADAGVARNITLDETTHADEISTPPNKPGNGWIETPRDRIELRRIPYLSRLRNISLQPLRDLAENGTMFDYVLFLGDVVFTVSDILTLLNTNDGEYAAACSMDYSKPPKFYDTFALRDATGHEYATQTWPYFRSSDSRGAMKRSEPVPVTSCWNGIVFMPSMPFVGDDAITFRGIDDSLASKHLEGSECCLIHADNPASTQGIYLNPNVRVGYSRRAYDPVHSDGPWLGYTDIFCGLWKNRLVRWFTTPWFKEWKIRREVRQWEEQRPSDRKENGTICIINEMHVLTANGWAHV